MKDSDLTFSDSDGLRAFVRTTLGCSCPEETLRRIRLCASAPRDVSVVIDVGRRLLIYLVDGAALPPDALAELVGRGRAQRDSEGFNRIRLVLAGVAHDETKKGAMTMEFECAAGADARAHLHFVGHGELPDVLSSRLAAR